MGGSWDRIVQTVSKCLYSMEMFPKDATHLALLKLVKNTVNSRPLTYASCDPADLEPVTPNHCLSGHVDFKPSIPRKMEPEYDKFGTTLRRAQAMAEQFWVRWTRKYLPKLRREKSITNVRPLENGELAFITDERQPRNYWIRGYISAGADDQVWSVNMTTQEIRTKKTMVYKRTVVMLCPVGLRLKIQGPEGALNLGPECHRARTAGKFKCVDCMLAFHSAHHQHKKKRQDETGEGGSRRRKYHFYL
jgi:hypothetical protein